MKTEHQFSAEKHPSTLGTSTTAEEIIVVGGGLLGAAIAYGAARSGAQVMVLDQGDTAHRASRGNLGLVWVSGKGHGAPHYARWSRDAVKSWPAFALELRELTGVNVALRQSGGFCICLTERELQARQATLARIEADIGDVPFEVLNRAELKARLPSIGPGVVGGTFSPMDGDVNPLKLLLALHAGLKAHGVRVISGVDVAQIHWRDKGSQFEIHSRDARAWRAPRVVLAAGLGNEALAAQVGLHAPVVANRGQVLVTERVKPFLHYPTMGVRQTDEGTVQLGNTLEDVGLDNDTTISVIRSNARFATAAFPCLSNARLVRAWGCLRVLTPDGLPIYEESKLCPGAFVATSHSGVSLAAVHAGLLGPWMAGVSAEPVSIKDFTGDRFLDPDHPKTFLDAHSYAH